MENAKMIFSHCHNSRVLPPRSRVYSRPLPLYTRPCVCIQV